MKKKILALILALGTVGTGVTFADSIELTTEYSDLRTEFLSDLQTGTVTNIETRLKSYINELEALVNDYKESNDATIRSLMIKTDALIELVDDYDHYFTERNEDLFDYYDDVFDRIESNYKRNILGMGGNRYNNSNTTTNNTSALRNNYRTQFKNILGNSLSSLTDEKINTIISRIAVMEGEYNARTDLTESTKALFRIQLGVLREMLQEELSTYNANSLIDLQQLFQ